MHLYVICGHGAGDPGACGNGYSEAERVRALGARIAELGGTSVTLLDTSRNWYADKGIMSLSIPGGDALVELHMDSAGPGAHGGHVIIASGLGGPDACDRALAASVSAILPGRSQAIVERSDLANPNRAKRRGINYRLVENGFISSAQDLATFNARLDDIARCYLDAFGITATTGAAQAAPATGEGASPESEEGMADFGVIFNPAQATKDGSVGGLYWMVGGRLFHLTNADQPRALDRMCQAVNGHAVPRYGFDGTDPWADRLAQACGGWDKAVECPRFDTD
ncbi:MAG: N-acetylmuramoyl-L-alanine amidase [Coriobacteriaceae bacterium]|nr:N-acetylmuramoyl-L-alanine amidase [Coriobacteriaceae bacterium]